jgi:hypothetical protein
MFIIRGRDGSSEGGWVAGMGTERQSTNAEQEIGKLSMCRRRYSGSGVRAKAAINFTFRASATIVSGGAEKVRVCGGKGLRLVLAARSECRAMEEELHDDEVTC